jgi:hypothetical protein
MREIEDLPVVSSLSFIRAIGRDKAGYRANLRCPVASSHGGCTDGGCTVQQVGPIHMSTKHPTMRDCLRELLAQIQQDHGSDCVAAVQAWQGASSAAESTKRPVDEGAASRNANDVLMLRAQLKSLGQRAVIANKAALEAEKPRDKLHNQIEQIEQRLHPKSASSHDDAHEMLAEVDNWDLRDHRQQATRVQNCRNVQVGSRNNQSKPRTGSDGFLHHTRLGLVGWISYWCLGDSALAIDILVALINTLGLTELVSDAMASRKQKEAETSAKIVDLFKAALDEIKKCRTEQQRVELQIALACEMPPREAQGSKNGWIKPICDRLGLK